MGDRYMDVKGDKKEADANVNVAMRRLIRSLILRDDVPRDVKEECLYLLLGPADQPKKPELSEAYHLPSGSIYIPHAFLDKVRTLGHIHVIKALRETFTIGLKEAKDVADNLRQRGLIGQDDDQIPF